MDGEIEKAGRKREKDRKGWKEGKIEKERG